MGFPAVIKPISGAASIGVIRVDDPGMLAKSYTRVQRDLRRAKIVAGALQQGDQEEEGAEGGEEEADGNAGTWINLDIMMEEVWGCCCCCWRAASFCLGHAAGRCVPVAWQQQLLHRGMSMHLLAPTGPSWPAFALSPPSR